MSDDESPVMVALRAGEHFYNTGNMPAYLDQTARFRPLMSSLAAQDQIDMATAVESLWYNRLVKKVEDEKHYRWCFAEHTAAFWNAGLRVRKPRTHPVDKNVIIFAAASGGLLGHTEVMLRVLTDLKQQAPGVIAYFAAMEVMTPDLAERLDAIGVRWLLPPEPLKVSQFPDWLSLIVETVRASTVIWMSLPCLAPYFFGCGLADKQVFWSLKFKCYELPEEIIHIGYPHREYGLPPPAYLNRWRAYMPPFSYDMPPSTEAQSVQLNQLRERFGSGIIFGSLAREEILNQPDYINAVVRIMQAVPEATFLYTGRFPPVLVAAALENHGLSARSHFVGWVDTAVYARLLSVFLEPFPFGCGVTIAQAIGCGTRAVSLWTPSVFATAYFKSADYAKPFAEAWKVATTVDEYVAMAVDAAKESLHKKAVPLNLRLLEKERSLEFLEKIDLKI